MQAIPSAKTAANCVCVGTPKGPVHNGTGLDRSWVANGASQDEVARVQLDDLRQIDLHLGIGIGVGRGKDHGVAVAVRH